MLQMSSNNKNTALIMFAVIAAFGLVMATAVVLPIIPQADAKRVRTEPPACNRLGAEHTPPSPPCLP
jgi:hypothetical protein